MPSSNGSGGGGNQKRPSFVLGDLNVDDSGLRTCPSHPLFTELSQLVQEEDGHREWKQRARWVKYEESVEQGGNRWSKPHVATVSLHALHKLRNYLVSNVVILDMEAHNMEQIVDQLLEKLEDKDLLGPTQSMEVRAAMLRRHIHLYNQYSLTPSSSVGKIPIVRSFAEIGRSMSSRSTGAISGGEDAVDPKDHKGNKQFMKKLPKGSEASNILIGELDCLDQPFSAFIRLEDATHLGELTEVKIPTRFLFVLLGPKGKIEEYQEVGRAMATLFSDDTFHGVAYQASNRKPLIRGLDVFLDATTVLPPGTWDPSIRIEPPDSVPPKKKPDDEPPMDSEDEEIEEARIREEMGLIRTGRLFGGLINDLKRKVPWYWSDFKDSAASQCIASWLFLYFACLTPIITFGGLLGKATHNNMAAVESLVSGFVCGIGYGFLSGQPLTILGSTGPVLVFETILVQFCQSYELNYLEFRLWVGIWVSVILIIMVAMDASAYVCFITRFTEENFATLIALIFMVEAVKNVMEIGYKFPVNKDSHHTSGYSCECQPNSSLEHVQDNITWDWDTVRFSDCEAAPYYGTLVGQGCKYVPDVFLMSIVLFIGTFLISYILKDFKQSPFFPSKVRMIVSDFAVIIAIISMTLFDMAMKLGTPKLNVPAKFEPTLPTRGWLINPMGGNPVWTMPAAILPALLATILIFMDQQITAVIMNRKEHKLKKGCGYHLDLLVLAVLICICSFIGIPWFVAATVLSMNHVNSLKMESESAAPGEKPQFLGIREQRVTHILIFLTIGLSVFMTPLLRNIPMPVLYGVFLYMGFSSLKGMQLFDRIMIMFMPSKYQPDFMFLRKVPIARVHMYTIIQLTCLIGLWVVKSVKKISILFPMMLVIMIIVRKLLDFVFTKRELKILDDTLPKTTRPISKELAQKKLEKGGHLNNNLTIMVNGSPLGTKGDPADALNAEEKQRLT